MSVLATEPGHAYRRTIGIGLIALLSAAFLLIATPRPAKAASSTALPPSLAKFAHCPISNPAVTLCLFSSTTSTSFTIGSTAVSSTSPATISLGVIFKPSGAAVLVLPTDGSPALASPAIPVPGGLTGIPGLDGGPLQVTATPQLVGEPMLSLKNLVTGTGAALTLPIDVLVSTPSGVLGKACTIASASTPITLHLTTGTTKPPAPNTPITGARGTFSSTANGLLTISGLKLVDNAFAVPGTSGCGPLGILDPILNLDKKLPSAAGSNTAILAGASYTVPASLIRKYLG